MLRERACLGVSFGAVTSRFAGFKALVGSLDMSCTDHERKQIRKQISLNPKITESEFLAFFGANAVSGTTSKLGESRKGSATLAAADSSGWASLPPEVPEVSRWMHSLCGTCTCIDRRLFCVCSFHRALGLAYTPKTSC